MNIKPRSETFSRGKISGIWSLWLRRQKKRRKERLGSGPMKQDEDARCRIQAMFNKFKGM